MSWHEPGDLLYRDRAWLEVVDPDSERCEIWQHRPMAEVKNDLPSYLTLTSRAVPEIPTQWAMLICWCKPCAVRWVTDGADPKCWMCGQHVPVIPGATIPDVQDMEVLPICVD